MIYLFILFTNIYFKIVSKLYVYICMYIKKVSNCEPRILTRKKRREKKSF